MKVREMSPDERPREKAKREGLSALSNRELIALLLQSGTKSKSVLELADEVLSLCGSLGELMYMDPNDLMEINGIKEVRAIQLFAGIELCRRIDRSSLEKVAICSPDDLVRWLRLSYGYAQQEHFIAGVSQPAKRDPASSGAVHRHAERVDGPPARGVQGGHAAERLQHHLRA